MQASINAFCSVLEDAGLLPGEVIADGRLHRCPTKDKPKSQNGRYIAHDDSNPTLWYEDKASGEEAKTWTAKREKPETPDERNKRRVRMVSVVRNC